MNITDRAKELCDFLETLPEVKSAKVYGSLVRGETDQFLDIDIEIDVSGTNNGLFLLELEKIFRRKYSVLFFDYAPSLAPEKYVVTLALYSDNPFMLVDIACTASPHCAAVSRQELRDRNHPYHHVMKLFIDNLKHFIRGWDCSDDIWRMWGRLFPGKEAVSEWEMLRDTYRWLCDRKTEDMGELLKELGYTMSAFESSDEGEADGRHRDGVKETFQKDCYRLETKDLIMKAAEFEDWKEIYTNLWCHEESAKYMLWQPTKTEEDAQERMRRTIAFQKKCNSAWFVYEKQSGQAIGFAGMTEIEEGVWEDTGVAVGPAFVGKGYGKQILTALVRHCFETRKAKKVVCSCRSGNVPSRKLQLSCGFRYTHSESRVDNRNGEAYTLEFYELEQKTC